MKKASNGLGLKSKGIVLWWVLSTSFLGAQSPVAIPLGSPLEAEVPLEYTFNAGTERVQKTVFVKLVVSNLTAYHSGITSFADGGLMGGFSCDILFNTWFSYTQPQGVYVDGEWIPFTAFRPQGIRFTLQGVRFQWTQNNGNHRYSEFDMGSPSLETHPKGDKPGYTSAIYIFLKDIVGDHGSCAKDMEVVKNKGAIEGRFLQVDGISFHLPYELKTYLQEREERKVKETGYYTANGFTNQVKTSTASADKESHTTTGSSPKTNAYPNSNSSNSNKQRVDNYNHQLRQQGNQIYQQSQQTWAAYQQAIADIKKMFNQPQVTIEEDPNEFERRERTRQQMEYLDTDISFDHDAGSIEEQYQRKKAEERAWEEGKAQRQKEREAQEMGKKRQAIINAFPVATFPQSDSKLSRNALYYFLTTARGARVNEPSPTVYVSNVFAIGKYPDGTYPFKTTMEAQLDPLTGQREYLHGYFTSAEEAQAVLHEFKTVLTGLNLQVKEVPYSGKNTAVALDLENPAVYLGNVETFGEAERAYLSGDYKRARALAIELEKQGFQKSAILYLKIIATAGIPAKELSYEQGVELKADMAYYLENYNIKGLEDKYRVVAALHTKEEYELGILALNEAERYYEQQAFEKAGEWYSKSAHLGNIEAQCFLAEMYFKGEGLAQDYQKALEWFQLAANAGHPTAQNNLGYMYRTGKGVAQDYATAIAWYLKAAEQENEVSQYRLGMMYYKGDGVTKDDAEAAKWLEKAARNGHLDAAYGYGFMLNKGIGVQKNIPLSLQFIKEAARRGHKKSQEQLKKLNETW